MIELSDAERFALRAIRQSSCAIGDEVSISAAIRLELLGLAEIKSGDPDLIRITPAGRVYAVRGAE